MVERISNIPTNEFTYAIYGPAVEQEDERFIDSDLKLYNLKEMLYKKFKEEGYFVVFYNSNSRLLFHSYDRESLEAAFNPEPQPTEETTKTNNPAANIRKKYFKSTEKQSNPAPQQSETNTNSQCVAKIVPFGKGRSKRFHVTNNIGGFTSICNFINNHEDKKIVFILPEADFNDATSLGDLRSKAQEPASRIVVIANSSKREIKNDNTHKDIITINGVTLDAYCIGRPSTDEFRNLLNRRRILDKCNDFMFTAGIEKTALLLRQRSLDPEEPQKEMLKHYIKLDATDFQKYVQSLNTDKAMDRLKALPGIDEIVKQIEDYIAMFKFSKEDLKLRFRPHLFFSGPPGTGKTTVANLLAQILQDEGLLPVGQYIKASVSDLISEYVGGTRIKTRQVCERAKGGVLFIDEAYGLISKKENHSSSGANYEAEAMEELIQFMENESDSLVIFAGYEDQMKELLETSNPGFKSRFNGEDSFIHFTEYSPEALFKIFKYRINDKTTTAEFDNQIINIITHMYNNRSKEWGNAREMETLSNKIRNYSYRRHNNSGILSIDDIPEELLKFKGIIPPMDRLKAMPGMESVAAQIENYIESLRDAKSNNKGPRFRPHLIFSGNPGTGKTTVARLLAEILRQEGILKRGQLKEAKVGDLIAEYLGQTRPKTRAVCNEAKGGVLFIDEAYGLISGANAYKHIDYGKEAIEELIQFMENDTDSLVIMAGYTEDMDKLLREGNKGLSSRINHNIHFEDYAPEALYEIFKKQIETYDTTPEFDLAIQQIIFHMHSHKNFRWGNAREMENLAQSIVKTYRKTKSQGPIDITHIPDDKMRYIKEDLPIYEILKEVDALVGLSEIKQNLRTLCQSTLGRREDLRKEGKIDTLSNNKLNLLWFVGNPGTGKTTVANLMSKILYNLGMIDEIKSVKVQPDALLTIVNGENPVERIFKEHSGKVILIDEAYRLKDSPTVIHDLVDCIFDKQYFGKQVVIMAGYTNEMQELLSINSGLERRISKPWWHFADYTNEELWTILTQLTKQANDKFTFAPVEECIKLANDYFDARRAAAKERFGNVQEAIDLFDAISTKRSCDESRTYDLIPAYFPNYVAADE